MTGEASNAAIAADPRCVECLVRQAVDVGRLLPAGPARAALPAQVRQWAQQLEPGQPPAFLAQAIHRRLRDLTGNPDPYREAKRMFNDLVVSLLPELRALISQAPDPLLCAARVCIAANIIDLGHGASLTAGDAMRALRGVMAEPWHADWSQFLEALSAAQRVLYLADNAGEIVADRLLIEAIGTDRVTVAVRGKPIINDATMDDARAAGLIGLVPVISNGSDAPGTLLADCSRDFRQAFDQADLIIAKGQGNFESLAHIDRPSFLLLKVKCPVVAEHVGLPVGTQALLAGPVRRS